MVLSIGCLLVFILAACQSSNAATQPNFGYPISGLMGTPNPEMMTRIASNPQMQTQIAAGGKPGGFGEQGGQMAQVTSATPSPESTSTPEPTATVTAATYPAEQTARKYFTALESSDFTAAVELVSAFSKTVTGQTSNEIVAALTKLKSSGWECSNFKIIDSQVWDKKTVLVHVTYTESVQDTEGKSPETAKDELWPIRLEAGKWLYNWTNIIDYNTLSVDSQQVGGLTMKPLELIRYSDKIRLVLLVQNDRNGATVIGLANQILATFHFSGKSVDAVQTKYLFDAHRSYTDVYIDVRGLYKEFPDSVEIVKFTNTTAAPWFTFGLVE